MDPINLALNITSAKYGHLYNWKWHEESVKSYGKYALDYIGSGKQILDIGYGFGTISIAACLACNNVTAVDLFMPPPQFFDINWMYPYDVQCPDFILEQKFDNILMLEVLEHFNFDITETLLRLVKMLKPKGHLIIATPDKIRYNENLPDINLPTYKYNAKIRDAHIKFYDENDLDFVNIVSKIEIGPRNIFIIGG